MKINKDKMVATYIPITREQLEKMSQDKLMTQYQSLVDLIKETKGIPFERNPNIGRDELIRLIDAGQSHYSDDINRVFLANSLVEFAKRGDILNRPILFIGG